MKKGKETREYSRKLMKKKWLKTLNRGVILTVLTLICLVLYVVIGNVRFNSQHKPKIKETIQEYLDTVNALNRATDAQKANGFMMTKEEREQYEKNVIALRDKFWSDRYQNEYNMNTIYYYGEDLRYDIVNGELNRLLKNSEKSPVLYSEFLATVSELVIKKNSPNTATVDGKITVSALAPTNIQASRVTTFFSDICHGDNKEGPENNTMGADRMHYFTMELVYEDGAWKIIFLRVA